LDRRTAAVPILGAVKSPCISSFASASGRRRACTKFEGEHPRPLFLVAGQPCVLARHTHVLEHQRRVTAARRALEVNRLVCVALGTSYVVGAGERWVHRHVHHCYHLFPAHRERMDTSRRYKTAGRTRQTTNGHEQKCESGQGSVVQVHGNRSYDEPPVIRQVSTAQQRLKQACKKRSQLHQPTMPHDGRTARSPTYFSVCVTMFLYTGLASVSCVMTSLLPHVRHTNVSLRWPVCRRSAWSSTG